MRMIALGFAAALALGSARAHETGAGEAGDGRGPIRTIEVTASDADGEMGFAPTRVAVSKGEQIRFVVWNRGALAHEFVIGSKADNVAHKAMMAEMPDMPRREANAVTIAPGRSATLLWRFTRPGVYEYACLIPGHYEKGMHAVVEVK